MNPYLIAQHSPGAIATVITETGQSMSYAELDDKSRRFAAALQKLGLGQGGHIALMLSNGLDYHPICWGAWFAGLYFTPISTHLKAAEVEYLITNSGSTVVICGPEYEAVMREVQDHLPALEHWYSTAPQSTHFKPFKELLEAEKPLQTTPNSPVGSDMLYSSGTTGRPKGILRELGKRRDDADPLTMLLGQLYGFDADSVYLTPAPLYHAAPLKFSLAVHMLGGTNVVMRKFDAEQALLAIQKYQVTHSQWVPTMLQRLHRLAAEVKDKVDLSTHKVAVHAAAPCPPQLKQELIDWWGPILHEYYGGSEVFGMTALDSDEWLAHPGSVGKPVLGELHIVDEAGEEVPTGEVGHIYFGNTVSISYHRDPEKTKSVYLDNGWITYGDMGRVDEDGFLYLADRKDFMIITGGVNVYPKEIEDVLAMHEAIFDVAVFGVPNPEFGEEVKAVVQPVTWPADGDALSATLEQYCRAQLSRIKVPRSFDFVQSLPREANGKLYKKPLRQEYLARMAD